MELGDESIRQNGFMKLYPENGTTNRNVDVDMLSNAEQLDKDESEEELERLVFGDTIGFREGLRNFRVSHDESAQLVTTQTGLEEIADAELFFTDIGGTDDIESNTLDASESEDDTFATNQRPSAWDDSDDERMVVSLAAVPRLRKLRRNEGEDVINGREYAKRLQKQFELLHPRPEWATGAISKPARKKRRTSEPGASDEYLSSDDEDAAYSELPSVAPLATLLQNTDGLTRQSTTSRGKKRKLRPETIEIQRTKDIAGSQPSAITSLSFHPHLPLLLSSGPSATLYLHQIASSPPAPHPNPLLTSLHIRKSALTTTAFHPHDSRIFLSARRRYFHVWNLQAGQVEKVARIYGQQHEQRSMERFKLSPDGAYMALLGSSKKGGGVINVLSASTLQWVCQVRIEGRGGIADFSWWRDSHGMSIASKGGEVTEWSVQSQQIVARWQDEGAVGTTTIALGGQHELVKSGIGTDRWIALGSSSGIVNIYDRREWLSASKAETEQLVPAQPKPTRTLDQLTTPTSNLVFSPDGQIMAMSSKWKRDALRLVHLPSCTVYRNWPTSSTPLGRISSVAFCSNDSVAGDAHSLLAIANEQGKIRLWEIR